MTAHERELALLHFTDELRARLERVRGTDKAHKIGLRMTRGFFEADAGAIVVARPDGVVEARFRMPQGGDWTRTLEPPALRRRPPLPGPRIWAPIRRKEREWGWLVLDRRRPYARADQHRLQRVAQTLSRLLRALDRERLSEVRARIDRKILEQVSPKDLFYQILDALRSLTRYDHSAAVLIHEEVPGSLELVAEKIAWRKAKSTRVGRTVALDESQQSLLEAGRALGYDRVGGAWRAWSGGPDGSLAARLDLDRAPGAGAGGGEAPGCMIVAPFATKDGLLGAMKIAARHPGTFCAYEATLVERFAPQAAIAIRTLRRTKSLEAGMLEAERKHVVANLARGVSHDVNNALGAVLPLVQQMLADAREGRLDPRVLVEDLEQVEDSVRLCRRIFSGMLGFARHESQRVGDGNLRAAVDTTLSLLDDAMTRHGVEVVLDLPEGLPRVRGGQGELEQLVLNLATNARDAMPAGGRLTIAAGVGGRRDGAPADVRLVIEDTGTGIAPEHRRLVQQPFFSTKRHGQGLGLAICRAIVWEMGGQLSIDSEPGRGTRVVVHLPAVDQGVPA